MYDEMNEKKTRMTRADQRHSLLGKRSAALIVASVVLVFCTATYLYAAGLSAAPAALATGTAPTYTAGTAISATSVTTSFKTLYDNIPVTNTNFTLDLSTKSKILYSFPISSPVRI